MKKRLLIVALLCAVTLIALQLSRSEPVANTSLAQISTLQQTVGSTTEADMSTARRACHHCKKDPVRCAPNCDLENCPGGCN